MDCPATSKICRPLATPNLLTLKGSWDRCSLSAKFATSTNLPPRILLTFVALSPLRRASATLCAGLQPICFPHVLCRSWKRIYCSPGGVSNKACPNSYQQIERGSMRQPSLQSDHHISNGIWRIRRGLQSRRLQGAPPAVRRFSTLPRPRHPTLTVAHLFLSQPL